MNAKQIALETVQQMPENATFDDIAHRLQFIAAIQKGIDQVTRGEIVSHEQVKKELASWLSK